MGTLLYGTPAAEIKMEDRLLAHLKVVIVAKLRRNESFLVSWEIPPEEGSGRMSLWMHPSIPMQFRFAGSRTPPLNRAWLEEMADTAGTAEGLRILAEPLPSGEHPQTGTIPLPPPVTRGR